MAIVWSDLRTQVQRSILFDSNETTWTKAMLLDYVGWALDFFAAHTAVATATSFDGTSTSYTLPTNLYDEPLADMGAVYYLDTIGNPVYLKPVGGSLATFPRDGEFSQWPKETLLIGTAPDATLNVNYFAYYNHPVADSDLITVPQWARLAISYLIGYNAMNPIAVQTSDIRRWNDKKDSGNPEHNPLIRQQAQFMKLYQDEIARVPRQNRSSAWKTRR